MTVLSVEVDAWLGVVPSAAFLALPAAMLAVTVPLEVMPETAMSQVFWLPESVRVTVLVPPAVPPTVTSPGTKLVTAVLNTAVK